MTQVAYFEFSPFAENTYVVYDESGECAIFDPGCYTVQEMTLPTAEGPQPLQLGARLDSGLYHIVVRAQDGTVRTERFVLQRN